MDMPVLNYNEYDLLISWERPEGEFPRLGPPNRIQKKLSMYSPWNWLDDLNSHEENYFYIEFYHADAFYWFSLETIIPPEILWRIKQGEVTLVLGNTAHGYHHNVDWIYRHIVIRFNLKPEQVLLRTASADIYEEVEIIAKKFNLKPIRVDWVTEFEFVGRNSVYHDIHNVKTLELKNYTKKFLSYNGFYRPHRGMLLYLLKSMNLLDLGYVSYNVKSDVNGKDVYDHLFQSLNYNQEINSVLENHKDEFINFTKLLLDSDKDDIRQLSGTYDTQYEHFSETYFSVVTETSFTNKVFHPYSTDNTEVGRILSEKIFRTIMLKHPLIVLSNPKVLQLLHYLGYKTFSPLIDESYDLIEDPAERILAVAKEIKRLCELTPEQVADFVIKAREITEYNYNILKNKNEFSKPLPLKL